MELIEYAAAREAMEERKIEERKPLRAPLDLLSQHVVTLALGGGFEEREALKEIVRPGRTGRSPRRNGSGFWSS